MPRKRGNPSWGTSYFTSKGAAVRYYKDYEGDLESAKHAVEIKLREGSIHIGKPPLKAGQRLSTTDGGKRYMIVEENTRRNPFSLFKKYYVTCDGKKFGPYHTMAKAKKVAETVARVLDKPAKILGAVKSTTNPSVRKRKRRTTMTKKEAEAKAIKTSQLNGRPFKVTRVVYSNGESGWDVTPATGWHKANPKRKRNSWLKRAITRSKYMVLDGEGHPVHTGRDLSKTEALKIAKAARRDGEKGIRLVKSNPRRRRR